MTRVLPIVVGTNREDVVERMLELIPKIAHKLEDHEQQEMATFIRHNHERVTDLSLRFVVHLTSLILYSRDSKDPTEWKRIALAMH